MRRQKLLGILLLALLLAINYVLAVFTFAFFFTLNFVYIALFTPRKILDSIPEGMQKVIRKHKKDNKTEFARKIYDFVGKRYSSEIRGYFLFPKRLFRKNLSKLWKTRGYLPCDKQAFIFRTMLLKSGKFRPKEIIEAWMIRFWTPHQYLKIKLDGRWVAVDLWGADHGGQFGSYALKDSLYSFLMS